MQRASLFAFLLIFMSFIPLTASKQLDNAWYGLYMQGHKVGWMHAFTLSDNQMLHYHTVMKAQVRGMGQEATIQMKEVRSFDKTSKLLAALHFEQNANNMQLKVTAKRNKTMLVGAIRTAGIDKPLRIKSSEQLHDQLAAEKLITNKSAKVGDTVTATRYEPSLMKNMTVQLRVHKITPHLVDGVQTKLYHIHSKTIEPAGMGLNTKSVLDADANLLKTEIGGFFIAKLEPQKTAKSLGKARDILVSAVVKLPPTSSTNDIMKSHAITFSGIDADFSLPQSSFQTSKRSGSQVVFDIKQAHPPKKSFSLPIKHPESIARFLEDTPLYQSKDRRIRARAQSEAGGSHDGWQATKKLVQHVSQTLEKSYAPAMPNAVDVLLSNTGDCTEHSTLFVALARSLGIPARQAVGIAYWPDGGGYGWHAWAEVWLGKWYPVDPTWGQKLADTTHIAFAYGDVSQQAKIAALLGKLRIKNIRPQ